MSNYLAIATVTATLKRILEEIGARDVPGATVTLQPPDKAASPSGDTLNLFLYQVAQNQGYRNIDLPARNAKGELVSRPLLGLDLHYLMTAYASDNNDLQAHKIIASAMRILHERPFLTKEVIRETITAHPDTDLLDSDLDSQVELVKLTQESLSLEETTKLWSSFFQTNYRLSVSYQATVVLLEGRREARPTLPVQERLVHTLPFRQPVVDKVDPQIVEWNENAKLTITGRNLSSDMVAVQFDNLDPKTPQSTGDIRDNRILISIPTGLAAGVRTVRVIHQLMLGSPEIAHKGHESNVIAFVLAPLITRINDADIPNPNPTPNPIVINRNDNLVIEFQPAVTEEQHVAILVGDHTFSIAQHELESFPVNALTVRIPNDFPTGTFLVRLQVNGAESILTYQDNKFTGPEIEVI